MNDPHVQDHSVQGDHTTELRMPLLVEAFGHRVRRADADTRKALDAQTPIDWAALESGRAADAITHSLRGERALPDVLERLLRALIADVGINIDDVVTRTPRYGSPSRWSQTVEMRFEGECYRLDHVGGADAPILVAGATLVGYASLALDLATLVRHTVHACVRYARGAEGAPMPNARSSIDVWACRLARLLARFDDSGTSGRSARAYALAIEETWNTQHHETRRRLATMGAEAAGRDACPPKANPYAPSWGERLHIYDPRELRWLHAITDRHKARGSGREASVDPDPDVQPPDGIGSALNALCTTLAQLPYQARTHLKHKHALDIEAVAMAFVGPGAASERRATMEQTLRGLLSDAGYLDGMGTRWRATADRIAALLGQAEHDGGAAAVVQARHAAAYIDSVWRARSALRACGRDSEWIASARNGSDDVADAMADPLRRSAAVARALEERGDEATSMDLGIRLVQALTEIGMTGLGEHPWADTGIMPDPLSDGDMARLARTADERRAFMRRTADQMIASSLATIIDPA